MNRLLLGGAGALLGAALALGVHEAVEHGYGPFAKRTDLHRLTAAFARVRDAYVVKPDDRTLVGGAIDGMLTSLDAHSSYFDPRTYQAMQTKAAGAYGGVGLVVGLQNGIVAVVRPMEETPALRAGLKAGDLVLSVDGTDVKGHSLEDVSNRLRGTIGQPVVLTVGRGTAQLTFRLVREAIEVERLTFHPEGDVGYVKISAFSDRTDPDLRNAIVSLQRQIGAGLKGYVIDLRDNGGGVLQAAVDVADDFLDDGEIVSVRGRNADNVEHYDAHDGDIAGGKPIVVLINGGTASASEIVAGALQDWRRATIMGMTSFGKGSVQSIIPLDNGAGGALHMTTARYYTPTGRSIQATGIVPDIAVAPGAETPVYQREVQLPRHLLAEGPKPKPLGTPLKPVPGHAEGDFQLATALAYLRKTVAMRVSLDHA